MQLGLAYLFAAGLIAGLFLLARRNRKRGWKRRRAFWLEDRFAAALRTVESPSAAAPLQHLGDLGRLHESLVAHAPAKAPERADKPMKSSVLT